MAVGSDIGTFIRSETDFSPHLDTEPYRHFSIGKDAESERVELNVNKFWNIYIIL
jgi:hypothetical protein